MYQGHQATLMHTPDQHRASPGPSPPEAEPPAASGRRQTALPAGPESIATARDFTAMTLRGWRLDVLVRDAVMVASELVTNAIRHGSRYPGAAKKMATPEEMAEHQIGLAWCRQASRLVCVVTDSSTQPPLMVPAGPDAESGRGLQIVHAVATAWGWTMLNAEEKAVWAAFRLPG
jgi:anti-sigma regulatory factor (Ser/Thr protein kinase)